MSRPVYIFLTVALSLGLVAWGVFSMQSNQKPAPPAPQPAPSGSVPTKIEGDASSEAEPADTFPGNWGRGRELYRKGYYSKAEQYISRSIDQASPADKNSDIYTDALVTLGKIQVAQWREKKAVPLAAEAVRTLTKKWGPESIHVAEALVVLGDAVYAIHTDTSPSADDWKEEVKGLGIPISDSTSMDNYDAAMALYQRALKIEEKKYGKHTPFASDALIGISTVYFATSKMDLARKYAEEAVQVTENADKAVRAGTLTSLGWIDLSESKTEDAEKRLTEALTLQEASIGHQHPETALTCFDLAQLYEKQENKPEAKKYYERALRIVMKRLRSDHPLIDTMKAGVAQNS